MNPYFVGAFSVQEVGVGASGGVGIFSCCKIEVLWQWLQKLLSPGVWCYVVWISWSTPMICGEILWNVGILLPHLVALCLRIPLPPGFFVFFLIGGSIFILDFKFDFRSYRLFSNTSHSKQPTVNVQCNSLAFYLVAFIYKLSANSSVH